MLTDEELLPQLLAVASVDVEFPDEVRLCQHINSTGTEHENLS
jgi:hypothetical protein